MFTIDIYTNLPEKDFKISKSMKKYFTKLKPVEYPETIFSGKTFIETISCEDCDIQDIRKSLEQKFGRSLDIFIANSEVVLTESEVQPMRLPPAPYFLLLQTRKGYKLSKLQDKLSKADINVISEDLERFYRVVPFEQNRLMLIAFKA